ncbi:hypothetical protein [Paenibacillus sp. FSL H8-0168]|uniref:hypothetical protein n=1 Tax=Paenibacillus sp. FSL H8-0168 TaxID=2921378 RepID=UPI00315950A3
MLVTRPTMVDHEEIKEIGGLRPLSEEERINIANMFEINENEITPIPLIRVVSNEASETPVPRFDEVLNFVMNNAPKPHVLKVMKEYFTVQDPDAGTAKGTVDWQDNQSPDCGPIDPVKLMVYYKYSGSHGNWE